MRRPTRSTRRCALAPQIGIPHQNLIVGDRSGHIGWTIAGRMPRGVGAERNDGSSGWLGAGEQPQIVDPREWPAVGGKLPLHR